jgi:hypothetical protein
MLEQDSGKKARMPARNSHLSQRNPTIDFFRGIALLIIFINHIPGNELHLYTPARFGLSDAAEIFVFLSGYTAALAYGRGFRQFGLWFGSLRVLARCWRIYTAHLALFFILAVICILGNNLFGEPDYIGRLNLQYFFEHTEEALLGLITLRYVPNYFDILPMYLAVMLWIPVVFALSRVRIALALGFSVAVYLAMWLFGLEFFAELQSGRPWFFNPFGWQLIFFTGFAFGSGWIRPPDTRRWLVAVCLLFVLFSVPLSPEPIVRSEFVADLYPNLRPWLEKTRFGPLRWLHFLALAYLMAGLFRHREHWLAGGLPRLVREMGQHSLPIFIAGMALSYIGGMVFDRTGHGAAAIALINLGGCLLLLFAGRMAAWLKSGPWQTREGMDYGGVSSAGGGLAVGLSKVSVVALLAVLTVVPLIVSQKNANLIERLSIFAANDWESSGNAVADAASWSADFDAGLNGSGLCGQEYVDCPVDGADGQE